MIASTVMSPGNAHDIASVAYSCNKRLYTFKNLLLSLKTFLAFLFYQRFFI